MKKLAAYVWTIAALGLALLIGAVLTTPVDRLMGQNRAAFIALGSFLIMAELRPIPWFRNGERGDLTASWTFAFAIHLVAPLGGALAVTALATIIGELSQRKRIDRCLFNLGQVMLSLFHETFPSFPDGTVLLRDEPEMALSVSNQRRILKMLMELVDRSRVADPPALVGPADWHQAANDNTRKD